MITGGAGIWILHLKKQAKNIVLSIYTPVRSNTWPLEESSVLNSSVILILTILQYMHSEHGNEFSVRTSKSQFCVLDALNHQWCCERTIHVFAFAIFLLIKFLLSKFEHY